MRKVLLAMLLVTACASTPEQSPTRSKPAANKLAWAEMNRDQRLEFMGTEVYPALKKAFQSYDGKEYAEFKCHHCHGKNRKEVDYKMPNELYALSKEDPIGDAMDYDEKIVPFMRDEVMPTVAALLGKTPGVDFTCHSCHVVEE